jgi:hypothetical protein
MPSPQAVCANLLPYSYPAAPNPSTFATSIGAEIKAGKNPPICAGENLSSQFFLTHFR